MPNGAADGIEGDDSMRKAMIAIIVALTMLANRFWAATTTLAIGAAKEALDDHFDRGDFASDCAGVLMYQIKF